MHVVVVIAVILLLAVLGGVSRAWLEERRERRRF